MDAAVREIPPMVAPVADYSPTKDKSSFCGENISLNIINDNLAWKQSPSMIAQYTINVHRQVVKSWYEYDAYSSCHGHTPPINIPLSQLPPVAIGEIFMCYGQPAANLSSVVIAADNSKFFRGINVDPEVLDLVELFPHNEKSDTGSAFGRWYKIIRLRIAGLGHHFELDASPGATLAELKEEVERRIDLPAPYQRLVAKRKKLDDDTMVLGSTVMDGNAIASMGIGLEDGTKILLLHSPLYERDREGIGKLTELMREIHKIDVGRRSREMENKLVQELVIQICCKVDGVETNGSEPLRKMRKLTIKRAEEVARKSEDDVRGVDP
ncbi:hypothetical protein ACHAWF_018487 [Thalassiosira exigua]